MKTLFVKMYAGGLLGFLLTTVGLTVRDWRFWVLMVGSSVLLEILMRREPKKAS